MQVIIAMADTPPWMDKHQAKGCFFPVFDCHVNTVLSHFVTRKPQHIHNRSLCQMIIFLMAVMIAIILLIKKI